jgi:DNA repair photolyase
MSIKGRGTDYNPHNRFAPRVTAPEPQEFSDDDEPARHPQTRVHRETAKSLISYNDSPDISFDRSINPYRGCEHGCIYCFARPTHAYLDLSPGLDFETRLLAKTNAADVLRRELGKRSYQCAPIVIGSNTDCYQPIEKQFRITRQILEVLWEHKHPCGLITKSQLILDDIDLLAQMARENLVRVSVSVTTLDNDLKRRLEPRAASGHTRLKVIAQLAQAGVPVSVLASPMIPALNDSELETILTAARNAGAESAGYILLRLPLEIAELFEHWLQAHFPLRAAHVMSLIRQSRGGRDYNAAFHQRMRGTGVFADLLETRFRRCVGALGLNAKISPLDTSRFAVPTSQLNLW